MSDYLETYGNYRPTGFDPAGAFLPERQDWLVGPVSITRDSGTLDQSNWATVVRDLLKASDPEFDPTDPIRDTNDLYDTEDVKVHRFGHWGPGWYEVVLIRPGSKAADVAEKWAKTLADYPVADESDFCRREHEVACEYWATLDIRERYQAVMRDGGPEGCSIFAIRNNDGPPSTVTGEIYSYLADGC